VEKKPGVNRQVLVVREGEDRGRRGSHRSRVGWPEPDRVKVVFGTRDDVKPGASRAGQETHKKGRTRGCRVDVGREQQADVPFHVVAATHTTHKVGRYNRRPRDEMRRAGPARTE
jgi:hypothetical protein